MSQLTILESRDTSFGYGDDLVLKDINFSILAGDFVALMGPNGSGKTTLLKTILGIFTPIKGEVLLDGKPVLSYKAKDRAKKIGYVSQEPTFSFPLRADGVHGNTVVRLFHRHVTCQAKNCVFGRRVVRSAESTGGLTGGRREVDNTTPARLARS